MPTLKEYKNKYGYYINAWTPETGNITYKIRDEGYSLIEDFEIDHEDEISWDTITSLKSLSLIYTEKSGTIATDEFEPDPEKVNETALSDKEAEELLDVILEHQNLTTEKIEELCEILGIEPPISHFEQLEDQIKERIEYIMREETLPSKNTLQTKDGNKILVAVNAVDLRNEIENGLVGLDITFIADLPNGDNIPIISHHIFVCQEHGIENWRIGLNEDQTWDEKGEVSRQKGILLPMVAETLRDSEIDPGNPSESPSPPLLDLEDTQWN